MKHELPQLVTKKEQYKVGSLLFTEILSVQKKPENLSQKLYI